MDARGDGFLVNNFISRVALLLLLNVPLLIQLPAFGLIVLVDVTILALALCIVLSVGVTTVIGQLNPPVSMVAVVAHSLREVAQVCVLAICDGAWLATSLWLTNLVLLKLFFLMGF